MPKVDTIRDTLKVVNISGLKDMLKHNIKKAVDNKVSHNKMIDGYTFVAIDGTKFFGSNKKSYAECLKLVKGEKTHSFHSGAVMAVVGVEARLLY